MLFLDVIKNVLTLLNSQSKKDGLLRQPIKKDGLLRQPIKKDGLLRQPIACYEIAKRTYDFIMIYICGKSYDMLFLVGNNYIHSYIHT